MNAPKEEPTGTEKGFEEGGVLAVYTEGGMVTIEFDCYTKTFMVGSEKARRIAQLLLKTADELDAIAP